MPKIKTIRGIEYRKVISQKEWLAARKKLLAKEKKFSKLRDALNEERRKLPWVKIEKEYVFDGPNGKVALGDLFCGKSQLIVYHTDSSYERGIDLMNTTYNFLDLTAKGRDENPEHTQDWVRYHDEYESASKDGCCG
jgi:predicted dithiol-disulfide oxidoreductase (DUF899 family)